ncbi:YciI family protein [Cryptosporangium japonicum]|uniref:YCII-related domain-containing protein n=1 Tax=Cryptosporangium japonicum TaxID=80872 RepID=A0ABN0UZ32_9ACTN
MIYAYQLRSPRPTFVTDMTDEEKAVMAEHTEYWKGLLADGVAVCFGAVLDPAGPYGLAVVEVGDQAEVDRIAAADPAVRAGLKVEAHPMPGGFVRP